MKVKNVRFVLVSILISFYLLAFSMANHDTFAWFTSKSTASGEITNATTSDLLLISGSIQYARNCKIRSSITIKNISTINIPYTLRLIGKNGATHEISQTLKPNESFTDNLNNPDNLLNDCKIKQVEYHLTALQSYIDESVILSVDQEKVNASVEQEEREPTTEKKEDKDLIQKGELREDTSIENEPGYIQEPEVETEQPEEATDPQSEDTSDGDFMDLSQGDN